MLRVTAGSCRALIRLRAIWRSSSVHFQVGWGSPGLDSFRRRSRTAAGCGQRVRRHERRGDAVADVQSGDLIAALDEASLSRFHLRAVVASGVGFFTDAYDLFVIGIASALITKDWHLSSGPAGRAEQHDAGGRVPGCPGVRALRGHGRPQAGVLAGRRDHDRRGAGLGAVRVVRGADRVPFPARARCRRRLPGQRGHGERVREPEGPRQAGRDGVRHAGARADRRAADRAGPARLGRQRRRGLAGPARRSARCPPPP